MSLLGPVTRIVFAVTALVTACSSDDEPVFGQSGATTGGGVCIPGAQNTCGCPGDAQDGVQVCKDDGSGFGACSCGSGSGGGGAGGQGAAGATGPGGGGEGGGSSCRPGASQACYSGPLGSDGVGLCVAGTQTCNAEGTGFGPCEGEVVPVPETCDTPGDDDCDGETNEGGVNCACVPGTESACYSAAPATENVGPCKGGLQQCNQAGTGYGPCLGEVVPQPETCSSPLDDDCDGSLNEEGNDCACNPNEQVSCYEGPPGTENIGACKSGTQTCNAMGTGFGPCLDQVLPSTETCSTPADDDCSGSEVPCLATWSKSYGSVNAGNGATSVASDAAGNTIVGFPQVNSVDFGNGPQTGTAIAKYGPTGALLWQKTFTGGQIYDLGVDASGNVIVGGGYSDAMNLGGNPFPAPPLNTYGAFAAGFDAQGGHMWSKSWIAAGGTNSRVLYVDVEAGGAALLGGFFQGPLDFGGGPIISANVNPGDFFIVKVGAGGGHVWTRHGAVGDSSYMHDLSFDPAGAVLVSGVVGGSINLGSGPTPSAGGLDLFLAKLAADGSPVAVKVFGDATTQPGPCYNSVDGAGNVYLAGGLYGSANFGGGPLSSAAVGSMFAVKLDSALGHLWSFETTSGWEHSPRTIDVDGAGNILLGGYFYGSVTVGGSMLQAAGNFAYDIFIAKYSTSGMGLGGQRFGDTEYDIPYDVIFDPIGARVVVGSFKGTIDFGSGVLQQPGGNDDAFIAKLAP